MINELENLKKKILYRASYRGTKEMDILMSKFVNKYIDKLSDANLKEMEIFLNFEDEVLLNYYQYGKIENNIDKNKISKIFRDFRI
tara:strand:- start:634 stop:891 length:258 start_codon:yes stop_codon:yes gene_type:complete